LLKALIIGVCLVLLSSCTAFRTGYNNGPTLSWWWLDGYGDFTREQAPAVRQALDQMFAWHRSTQLPEVAALLAAAQKDMLAPTTPAAACVWQDRTQALLDPVVERGIQEAADVLPLLQTAQLTNIAARQAKARSEMREEFLQADAAERLQGSLERAVKRAERIYGRLGPAQLAVVEQGVKASPFDPETWLQERERRQDDLMQVLRRLQTERSDRSTSVSALSALAERSGTSPVPAYRDYQARLRLHNCALAAQLHNATTPEQRLRARERLQGWEEDVRALMSAAATTPNRSVAPSPDLAPL